MEKGEMLGKLQEIFVDTLDNEDIVITEETKAEDIEEWDSLSHIMLIVEIEKQMNVRFTSNEISSWKNVGEMLTCIESKNNEA